MDHFAKLLNNFDRGVTNLLFKCGFDEPQLREYVQKYVTADSSVEDRLDKATKQFESLLVRLGLRESRLVVEDRSTDVSGS